MAQGSRRSRKLATALLLFALTSGLGVVAWKARFDSGTAWLGRESPAEWIRYPSPAGSKANAIVPLETRFRHGFDLPSPPATARLRVKLFREGLVRINGTLVPLGDCGRTWKSGCEANVTVALRPGANRLEVSAVADSALPATWVSLQGPGLSVVSDTSWEASLAGGTWRPVVLARAPPPQPRFEPFGSAISPVQAVGQRWPILVGFALLSALALAAWGVAARRRPIGDSPWPLRIALGVATVAWAALFANNWRLLELEWGFDAVEHLDYVRFILDRHALPMPDDGWSMFHPPLYYLVLAGVLGTAGLRPVAGDAAAWIRVVGLGLGLANLYLVAALLRRTSPLDPARQVVGFVIAAALPLMLYLHQFPSNEILLAALSSAAILVAYEIVRESSWSVSRHLLLGVLLGLALLTKLTALLLLPPILGTICYLAWSGSRTGRTWRLARVGASVVALLVVSGWHYARVWARFGTPIVTGWDNRPGLAWWVDPGYRTIEHFLRFGRVMEQPLFSGYNGLWDALYSTLWGDGLMSGLAASTNWPPWWSASLQSAGYLLAIVPSALVLVGSALALRDWIRSPTAEDGLLLSIAALTLFAIVAMSMRVPCVAQDKASYGLLALGPFSVFAARGYGSLAGLPRWVRGLACVAIGIWALTSLTTYWIDGGSVKALVTRAMSADLAGNKADAIAILRQARAEAPADWRVRLTLARLLTERGGAAQEVEVLLRPNDVEPRIAARQVAIALLDGGRGDFQAAAAAARQATALDPDDPDAWAVLGSALQQLGQDRAAATAWQEAIRIQPQDAAAHAALAPLLLRLGDPEGSAMHRGYAARLSR